MIDGLVDQLIDGLTNGLIDGSIGGLDYSDQRAARFSDQINQFLHQTVASNMIGELGLDRMDTGEEVITKVSLYTNENFDNMPPS